MKKLFSLFLILLLSTALSASNLVNPFWFSDGGVAFDPSDVTSLTEWFDANDNTTITTVDGSVSQWDSKEGSNYLEQGTGSLQPTHVDASDYVDFDFDYMTLNTDVSNKAAFFLISDAQGGDNSDAVQLIGELGASSDQDYVFLGLGGGADYTASIDGLTSNTGYIGINGNDLDGPGGNISSAVSGFDPFPTGGGLSIFYYELTNTANFDMIGAVRFNTTTQVSDVRIHEVFLFDAALSESDRQKMEGYIAHKWGITSLLPAGHPYKSTAP